MKYLITVLIVIAPLFKISSQEIEIIGQIRIVNGSEGQDRILTSDSLGVACWKEPIFTPYPINPKILFQSETNLCEDGRDWIKLNRLMSDSSQVVVGGLDLSLTDNFNAWTRIENVRDDRISIHCNGGIDVFNFLAIEEGVYTIDGKMVQSGRAEGITQTGTVDFIEAFNSPPIVFIMLNQSTNPTGTTILNIWNGSSVTNNDFRIWKNAAGVDDIFWIAMEQGTYTTEKWKWYAEREPVSSSNFSVNFPIDFFSRAPNGFGILESSGGTCRLKDSNKTSATFNATTFSASYVHLLFWEESN